MMKWREIGKSGEAAQLVSKIWEIEESMPRWFRNASKAWTTTEESFREFVDQCFEVHGLYDDDRLTAIIYIESEGPELSPVITVHFSVLERVSPKLLIGPITQLRDVMLRRGVRKVRGWILKKNFGLAAMLCKVGFVPSGLVVDYGTSHAKVLRWQLIELVRG